MANVKMLIIKAANALEPWVLRRSNVEKLVAETIKRTNEH